MPDLPAASGPCVLIRRAALSTLGGIDSHSFAGEHAFDDFSRRAATMGWRNVLCPAVYVVRQPGPPVRGGARQVERDRHVVGLEVLEPAQHDAAEPEHAVHEIAKRP